MPDPTPSPTDPNLPSTPTIPTIPVTPTTTPRPRDAQDRVIANDIAECKQVITTVLKDGALRTPLNAKGYDTQKLNLGLSLQIAANTTYLERQTAMGRQEEATSTLAGLTLAARQSYADFRRIARATFKSRPARTSLSLTGRVPDDFQQFVTKARASYEAGKKPEYQGTAANEGLAKFGYPVATLEALILSLDLVDAAIADQKKAEGDAQESTRMRDTAYGTLKNWMSHFRETAKVAFRAQPEQARKLDY